MKNIENVYRQLLQSIIGEDIERDGLKETPKRAACAFKYLTQGYSKNIDEVVNNAIFESNCNEMIVVKDIEVYSLCEHHLLPFIGKCHVGYVPNGKIIGLSKIARIVDVHARRLQIQENLTRDIAMTLKKYISEDIGVVIEAQHLCMMMRGVEKQNSIMKSSCMLGAFKNKDATRAEFLSLI
jgi:GTP cyclohydrolase I